MRVDQITCAIGAELSGVSIADAVHDDGLFAEIRATLLKHRVLFLRDQDITRAEHVAAGRIKIEINQRYRLEDAAQAHRDLESRKTTGSSIFVV